MGKHQQFKFGDTMFNCAFSSKHVFASKENCKNGAIYLLAIKSAICIKDLTVRINEYNTHLYKCKSNTSIQPWLKDRLKSAKHIPRYFACSTTDTCCVYYEHKMPSYFMDAVVSITRIHHELIVSGLELPDLPNLLTFANLVLDKLKKVKIEARKPSEKVTAPWIAVQGYPKFKFFPEFVTHNNTGFSTAVMRLLTTLQKLSEFMESCKDAATQIKKANVPIKSLENTILSDFDKKMLHCNKDYTGGLALLHADQKMFAQDVYDEIREWGQDKFRNNIFPDATRDKILRDLGARLVNGQLVL